MFRSSQNQKPPGSTVKGKQQQMSMVENYLLINELEIVNCITELGIPFQLEDLKKPSPPKIQLVFEMFADLLMGIRKETVEPILRAATEQLEYPETQQDAHTLMAFYVSLRTLMFECGIDDFTINDLAKPDGVRLTRILSYVINFTRFREERSGVITEHFQKSEMAKEKIEQLFFENEKLSQRVHALKQQRAKEEPMILRGKEVQDIMSEELRAFSKRDKALTNERSKLKQEKDTLIKRLEDRQYFITKTLQEAERIRPYIVDSPDRLQQVIADMGASLSQEKAAVDSAERKNRALQTSADSFAIVEQDVSSAIKVMEECEAELLKEEESTRKATRHHEILTQKQTDVREIDRNELVCFFFKYFRLVLANIQCSAPPTPAPECYREDPQDARNRRIKILVCTK